MILVASQVSIARMPSISLVISVFLQVATTRGFGKSVIIGNLNSHGAHRQMGSEVLLVKDTKDVKPLPFLGRSSENNARSTGLDPKIVSD